MLTLVGEDTALSTELIAIIIMNSHSQTSLFVGFLLCQWFVKKDQFIPLKNPIEIEQNKKEAILTTHPSINCQSDLFLSWGISAALSVCSLKKARSAENQQTVVSASN